MSRESLTWHLVRSRVILEEKRWVIQKLRGFVLIVSIGDANVATSSCKPSSHRETLLNLSVSVRTLWVSVALICTFFTLICLLIPVHFVLQHQSSGIHFFPSFILSKLLVHSWSISKPICYPCWTADGSHGDKVYRVTFVCLSVCLFVCFSAQYLKNRCSFFLYLLVCWACGIGRWPGRLSSFSAITLLVGSSDL